MSPTNLSIHRATISLDIPNKIAALIFYANNVVQKMTGNATFPTPTPTLAALTAAVVALTAAETAVLTRTKGAATVRNDKRTTLVSLLQQLDGYVQAVADATPENGAAIIESGPDRAQDRPARQAGVRGQAGPDGRQRDRDGRERGRAFGLRVAVQHRRRQDLVVRPGDHAGQDHHRRAAVGHDGAVPVPRGHAEGRAGGLERGGVAAREVASAPALGSPGCFHGASRGPAAPGSEPAGVGSARCSMRLSFLGHARRARYGPLSSSGIDCLWDPHADVFVDGANDAPVDAVSDVVSE
jgi:hypothetical protein